MKLVLVYYEKVPFALNYSFSDFFFALANRDKRGVGKYREDGNNILQSKKREDMEEAKSTKGEGGWDKRQRNAVNLDTHLPPSYHPLSPLSLEISLVSNLPI